MFFLYLSQNKFNPSDQAKIIVAAESVDEAVSRVKSFIYQEDWGYDVSGSNITQLTPTPDGIIYFEENGFIKIKEMIS